MTSHMCVTQYLRGGKSFEDLNREFGINVRFSDSGDLAIANYDQIESRQKYHPIVRECRALTLDTATYEPVARSFLRYFNLGESAEEDAKFDWGDFDCQQKIDGSLMVLYAHKGELRVNTRGSFAQGVIDPTISPMTWEDLFWSTGIDRERAALFLRDESLSLSLEICSLLNKVVAHHPKPKLVLLSAFETRSGREVASWQCDAMAAQLKVERPPTYRVTCLADIKALMEQCSDPTFEGFVVRDRHGNRLKIKRPEYVALHHLKSNGNICQPKNLLTLAFSGELDEALVHFPEVKPYADSVMAEIERAKAIIETVYALTSTIENQKEFALTVQLALPPSHSWLSSIFFTMRKNALTTHTAYSTFGERLLARAYEKGYLTL